MRNPQCSGKTNRSTPNHRFPVRMKVPCYFIHLTLAVIMTVSLRAEEPAPLRWTQLPDIPDAEGFAGSFAGEVRGRLIVAGGANFPKGRPWEGGKKVWYDSIWSLESPDSAWERLGKLSSPLGYGVSISTDKGLLCIGGSDATGHHAEVWLLQWQDGFLKCLPYPPLPEPCANACGVKIGDFVYVCGGISTPLATSASSGFWRLDLRHLEIGWQNLPPCPGPARMLASAGASGETFFLIGGASLKSAPDGSPERIWLRDAYAYHPSTGWRPIHDTPAISVAAPGPMPTLADGSILLLGGDDGSQIRSAPADHKGFPKTIYRYEPITDLWSAAGSLPIGLVTTPLGSWQGAYAIPGGEQKPGNRSVEVWLGRP
jgi:N-acetylneuraminate epimerase